MLSVTWEYVNTNEYLARYGSNIVSVVLFDDMLTIRIVSSTFIPGPSDSPITALTKSFILLFLMLNLPSEGRITQTIFFSEPCEIAFGFETDVGNIASIYSAMNILVNELTQVCQHPFAEDKNVFIITR